MESMSKSNWLNIQATDIVQRKPRQNSLFKMVNIFTLLFFCGLASSEIYFQKGAPQVNLAKNAGLSGAVRYSRDGRPFSAFIGIPYGKAERFEKSTPFPLWNGVKSVVNPGPICPQSLFGEADGFVGDEEGCLNLNVYVPLKNIKKEFPVMVWIHGGGFTFGDGVGYGPSFFMDEDVILVTINYRLGVFGFLSTGDEVIPGNNGLKDQVLALKWVQENIKAFGGDPNQVTIFGESAGAASVHLLLLSPTTDGLFQRAISQSNSAASVLSSQPNPRDDAVRLATYLKCPKNAAEITSEEIKTCFRKLPASELNAAQYSYRFTWPLNYAPFYFTPVAEPEASSSHTPFLTKSPLAVLEDNSKIQNVPWMIGVTEDEGCSLFSGLVLKKPELTEELDRDWNELLCPSLHLSKFLSGPEEELALAKKIRKFYFGNDKIGFETRDNLTNMYSDSLISYGVYRSALKVAGREDRKEPVYLYQYAYPGPVSIFGLFYELTDKEAKMVGHGDELTHQFILGETFAKEDPTEKHDSFIKPDSQDEKFSKNFVKLWASFAINGKPTHTWGEKSTKWTPISKMELKGEEPLKWYRIEQDPHYREDLYKERMQFWSEIYEEHILQKPFMKNSFKKTEL